MDHLEKSLDGGTEAGGVMELLMQESVSDRGIVVLDGKKIPALTIITSVTQWVLH